MIPSFYNYAKEYALRVRALAIIESGEDEYKVGDGGQAFGLLQMHPARFAEEARDALAGFELTTFDNYATSQIKCAGSYFTRYVGVPITLVVMGWRLGKNAVFVNGERDEEYWHRWQAAFTRLNGRPTAAQ
jgi:hypothetical protein